MDPIAEITKLQEEINRAKIDKAVFEDKLKELKKKNKELWETDDLDKIKEKIGEEEHMLENMKKERDLKIEQIKKELSKHVSYSN